jgi:beta-mannosidase
MNNWLNSELIELELNGLDSNAEIFLNGRHIGTHCNSFRPYVLDVKPWLNQGENILLIRLTTGVENISVADVHSLDGIIADSSSLGVRNRRGDARRVFVRKPQYTFGWDWSPRLASTAIAGDVKLRMLDKACIRHLRMSPEQHGKAILLTVTATIEFFHYYKTTDGQLTITLHDEFGGQYRNSRKVLLRSGQMFVDMKIQIDEPHLWWPSGLGEQHLYRVEAELSVEGQLSTYPSLEYGLRFVELDTRDKFAIIINGKRIFCKGANWIPSDAIYARVSDDRYDILVKEARDAHFNMLRIWGGGWYERETFYQACDRYGIMIWHDFMFACAPYPDHLDGFRTEVVREADYQTKRLQRHASIVLWCGSNENIWGFRDWWNGQTKAGSQIYNYILPDIVRRNCPEIPYWNSSPYGGDEPNSNEVGNHHHWGEAMMNPDMEKRITPEEYDNCSAKFVTEFGYVGACSKDTAIIYLDGASLELKGEVWQHHTNTFEKDTVVAGIRKHYADPEKLKIDDYFLYSALCQGIMLEYALDSMRYRANCDGSLFWMFNDCWGEIGWTIVDYYLRRKPSWYFVRRAFAPIRLILRSNGNQINLVVSNDTQKTISFPLEVGYISLDGNFTDFESIKVDVHPLERILVHSFERGNHDARHGIWVAKPDSNFKLDSAIFRAEDFRDLKVTNPGLESRLIHSNVNTQIYRISAQSYAHAVQLELPDKVIPSDNYFDLLPGESREIQIFSAEPIHFDTIEVSSVNG